MDFTDFDWPFDDIHARIREIDNLNPPPGFTDLNPNRFVPTHRRGRRRKPRRISLYQEERRELARFAAQMRADNRRLIREQNRAYEHLYNRWNNVNTDIQTLINREWDEPWSHREELIDLEITRDNLRNQLEDFN